MELFDFRMIMLKEDLGKMFLPMSFYVEDHGDHRDTVIEYDSSGYVPLSEWVHLGTHNLIDILDVFEKLCLILDRCKEVLIDHKTLEISIETVHVSALGDATVKIKYSERSYPKEGFLLEELIPGMASLVKETYSREYLNLLYNRIRTEKPGLRRTMNMLAQMKREVFLCGWIGKSRAI